MSSYTSLSGLELRRILESAFLPDKGVCEFSDERHITVKVYDELTSDIKIISRGVPVDQLVNSRAISQLIARIRCELQAREVPAKLQSEG